MEYVHTYIILTWQYHVCRPACCALLLVVTMCKSQQTSLALCPHSAETGVPCAPSNNGQILFQSPQQQSVHINQSVLRDLSNFVFTLDKRVAPTVLLRFIVSDVNAPPSLTSPSFINPSLALLDGVLWMTVRVLLQPSHATRQWDLCPDNSMYRATPCPPYPYLTLISMVAVCQLDTRLSPVSEVVALEYDLGYRRFAAAGARNKIRSDAIHK